MKNKSIKFLPALDLWNPAISAAVRNGQIVLQVGQWIRLGSNEKLSRFVCVKPGGSIWAVHPEGEKGITTKRFSEIVTAWTKPAHSRAIQAA